MRSWDYQNIMRIVKTRYRIALTFHPMIALVTACLEMSCVRKIALNTQVNILKISRDRDRMNRTTKGLSKCGYVSAAFIQSLQILSIIDGNMKTHDGHLKLPIDRSVRPSYSRPIRLRYRKVSCKPCSTIGYHIVVR